MVSRNAIVNATKAYLPNNTAEIAEFERLELQIQQQEGWYFPAQSDGSYLKNIWDNWTNDAQALRDKLASPTNLAPQSHVDDAQNLRNSTARIRDLVGYADDAAHIAGKQSATVTATDEPAGGNVNPLSGLGDNYMVKYVPNPLSNPAVVITLIVGAVVVISLFLYFKHGRKPEPMGDA